MSWFHGKINREEAERRLKYQGDYLVRSHGNGQFVLSCMDSGSVRHLLLVDPQGQVFQLIVLQKLTHVTSFDYVTGSGMTRVLLILDTSLSGITVNFIICQSEDLLSMRSFSGRLKPINYNLMKKDNDSVFLPAHLQCLEYT